ncbi:hypothetical protein DL96DRAFT_1720199 [Flagelloscypha sp. PMI_526]|nr:hypothetical protein DL96DRAFT_1720199 [Flagelloscypha sp. PMI_526]
MRLLPFEIIELIVQKAAFDDATWRSLTLVSHDIQPIADTIRFRHIIFPQYPVSLDPLARPRGGHAIEAMCSPHASSRILRWQKHVQFLTSPIPEHDFHFLVDIALRSCTNLVALSLSILPKGLLAISTPSLKHLQCNFKDMTSANLNSPLFQSLRSLMPTHITYNSWNEIFQGAASSQMPHLTQITLLLYVFPEDLSMMRRYFTDLSSSIHPTISLIIFSCSTRFSGSPDFEELVSGRVDPRFVFSMEPGMPRNPLLLQQPAFGNEAVRFWEGKVPESESFWGAARTLCNSRPERR